MKGSSDHVLTEANAKSTPFFVSIPHAILGKFVLGFCLAGHIISVFLILLNVKSIPTLTQL